MKVKLLKKVRKKIFVENYRLDVYKYRLVNELTYHKYWHFIDFDDAKKSCDRERLEYARSKFTRKQPRKIY